MEGVQGVFCGAGCIVDLDVRTGYTGELICKSLICTFKVCAFYCT